MAIRRLASQSSRLAGVRSFGAVTVAEYPEYISGAPTATEKTAANGLRIASITTPGETATVTAWIGAGSRYEPKDATGVASLFAATAVAAKGADIAAIGGQVTTTTSREHIVFEAKVLKENVAAATKLLGEMATGVADISASKACMQAYFEDMAPEAYEAVRSIMFFLLLEDPSRNAPLVEVEIHEPEGEEVGGWKIDASPVAASTNFPDSALLSSSRISIP